MVSRQRPGRCRGISWVFNSWGEKNAAWEKDNTVAAVVLKEAGLEKTACDLVLEGGSIHVDGEG